MKCCTGMNSDRQFNWYLIIAFTISLIVHVMIFFSLTIFSTATTREDGGILLSQMPKVSPLQVYLSALATNPEQSAILSPKVAAPAHPKPEKLATGNILLSPLSHSAQKLMALPQRYYYSAPELDQTAKPTVDINLEYPQSIDGMGGYVMLRLLINETGKIDQALIIKSEPAGVFDDAAKSAFAKVLYSPGIKNGLPVHSQMLVEARFFRETIIFQPAAVTRQVPPFQRAP